MRRYYYELAKAANTLVTNMFALKPGENFVITADTESDMAVVEAACSAAFAAGAKPMVVTFPSPLGVGKAADSLLPVAALTGALQCADAWVEFNNQWLLYSTPFETAMKENPKLRYMCLVGMDADMMVRLIGRIDQKALSAFLHEVANQTIAAKTMRITTPAGCDLECELNPENKLSCDDGDAHQPGMHMLGGQICFVPKLASISGTLVFDGTLCPYPGFLKEPVTMTVISGVVSDIRGGAQARQFAAWLDGFKNANMLRLAHGCYGLNPGAKLTGRVIEDERVWGATEWGLGYLSSVDAPKEFIDAPSHCDGVCLDSSVWLDGRQIMQAGRFVDRTLQKMAEELGMSECVS